MEDESPGLPLRQRVPGAARTAPAAAARPALPDSVLLRMQAAVNAARAEESQQDPDPSTEPIPRLTASGAVAKEDASPAVNGTAVNGTAVKHDHGARRKRSSKKNRAASAKPAAQPRPAAQSQASALPQRPAPAQPAEQNGRAEEPTSSASQLSAEHVDVLAPPKRTAPTQNGTPKGPVLPKNAPWGLSAKPDAPAPPKREAPTHSARTQTPAPTERAPSSKPAAQPRPAPDADRPWDQAERPGSGARAGSGAAPSPVGKGPPAASRPPVTTRPPAAPRTPAPPRSPAAGRVKPQTKRRSAKTRRPFSAARIITAMAVVVVAAGLVAFMLSSSPRTSHGPDRVLLRQEAANSKQAAAWVAQQVSRDALVSCDRQMCSALVNDGFKNVLVLRPAHYPLSSTLVIVTARVRSLFGSSLNQYAPAVIATVGSGGAQVSIRVIAPEGTAAYRREFAADLQDRKQIGSALVRTPNPIYQSASAAEQMDAGQVDARLLLAITELASKHPIYIEDFGNIPPGATSGVPLRYADLAETVAAAHLSSSAYAHAMSALASALPSLYRPLRAVTVQLPGGMSVLRIEFSAPTPIGFRP